MMSAKAEFGLSLRSPAMTRFAIMSASSHPLLFCRNASPAQLNRSGACIPLSLLRQRLTVNVLGLVPADLANLQLAVGGLGGAVTARKIVDDETQDFIAGKVRNSGLELVDVLNGVASRVGPSCQCASFHSLFSLPPLSFSPLSCFWRMERGKNSQPEEATDVGDLKGRLLQGGIGDGLGGGLNLTAVEAVGVQGVLLEDVAAGVELDGSVTGAAGLARLLGLGRGGGAGGQGRDGGCSAELHRSFSFLFFFSFIFFP